MRKWVDERWDVRWIFDYALELHASYGNNKSAPIPESARPEVERLLKKLGYRLVLRRLEHPRRAARGAAVRVRMTWENVGVAPPYRDARIAFRLARAGVTPTAIVGTTSILGWLPRRRECEETIAVPADVAPGTYELSVGLVDPEARKPTVRLAIAGRDAEGWHPLGRLEIRET